MPVENSKELHFGPPLTLLVRGFLNVEHNRNAVFIVLSDDALVRICPISLDYAIFFDRALCTFKVGQIDHWNHVGQSRRARLLLQHWKSLRGRNLLSLSLVEFVCVGVRTGAKVLLHGAKVLLDGTKVLLDAIPNALWQLIALTTLNHLQILIWSWLVGGRHNFLVQSYVGLVLSNRLEVCPRHVFYLGGFSSGQNYATDFAPRSFWAEKRQWWHF